MIRRPAQRLPLFAGLTAVLAASLSLGCLAERPLPAALVSAPAKAPASALTPAPALPAAPIPPDPAPAPAPLTEAPPVQPLPAAIGAGAATLALGVGRSLVDVHVAASSYVSIGVFGPQYALLGFDVVVVVRAPEDASVEAKAPLEEMASLEAALAPLRTHRPLDEDGLLPRIVSFRSPAEAVVVRVLVDASEEVELRRITAPLTDPEPLPEKGKRYRPTQAPSIGFPAPLARDEGYFLQSAARYQFARTDVIAALLRAFQRTRSKFRRDPIAIADISQWDGVRPATDLGRPRHISHEGGRDVDLALAASDEEPSTVRAHCTGVLIEQSVQGCGPGTVRGFDAQRMAYFLGALFETAPPVEKIFVDDVYLRELRKAAERLHERRVLKDAAFEGLSDDAIVRASPWHTDHLHVRFAGPPGKPAF